jgi:hypothetical protein
VIVGWDWDLEEIKKEGKEGEESKEGKKRRG